MGVAAEVAFGAFQPFLRFYPEKRNDYMGHFIDNILRAEGFKLRTVSTLLEILQHERRRGDPPHGVESFNPS